MKPFVTKSTKITDKIRMNFLESCDCGVNYNSTVDQSHCWVCTCGQGIYHYHGKTRREAVDKAIRGATPDYTTS